jgi:nondiscriminating aspartyl-tRNA synthetase
MQQRTLSTEISSKIGQKVLVKGWLYQLRAFNNFTFLILRDRQGLVQAIIDQPEMLAQLKDLQMESVLEIEGKVMEQKSAMNGAELQECKINILNPVIEVLPVTINKKELNLHLDTLLDHRPLTLRNPKQQAIFKIHGICQQAFREFMLSQDCVEFFPPTLLTGSSEGGSELFSVEYFEKTAKLSQSAQLYKQICIGAYERVFAIAKCFRAEKYATSRHLSEATQYEFELAFIDSMDDILEFHQETIRYMVQSLKEKASKELALLQIEVLDVPAQIPRITMQEAQEIVFQESEGKQDDRKEPDMSPEGERLIGAWAKREHQSNFVFITHYPRKKRAFYSMPNQENSELTDSFDCIGGGFEIASGAVRINDYEMLKQSAIEKGIDPATIEDYLNIFKFGMPKHGGFGMGVERFTHAILGVQNVREVTMFPRDVQRLRP